MAFAGPLAFAGFVVVGPVAEPRMRPELRWQLCCLGSSFLSIVVHRQRCVEIAASAVHGSLRNVVEGRVESAVSARSMRNLS